MYSKIMVPLDGSKLAECVLPHAETFISQYRVPTIIFIRVIESAFPTTSDRNPDDMQKELETRENERKSAAEKYLKQLIAKIPGGETKIETEVLVGRAADRLADYAENNDIDLILMATHGRSGIGRWVRGSVAERILRAASIPVLMVRAQGTVGEVKA
jgi:nucleotide-binding universal stress UspA family protein